MKKVYVFFFTVLILMLHLPFAFSKSKTVHFTASAVNSTDFNKIGLTTTSVAMGQIYDSLKLNVLGLSHDAFDNAVKGFSYLKAKGKVLNANIISIADFTKPSSEKRLFIIDLENRKILFNTYVAHGQNSGKAFANRFSNLPESFESSLGFYVTSNTYIGKNGYSMRLNGLEDGINDRADSRAIVMHGAPYVSEGFIKAKGYLGRSWGCPAVPEKMNKPIIEKIKNGTCLFIYSEDKNYLNFSKILNS